jgi:hypothetical protein
LNAGFSSDVTSRLVASFQSLNLIDNNGCPNKEFITLFESRETPLWRANLKALARKHYAFVDANELKTMGPKELYATFYRYAGRDDDTVNKAVSFFINLAYEAGYELSSPLQTRIKMANSISALRAARAKTPAKSPPTPPAKPTLRKVTPPKVGNGAQPPSAVAQLLDKLPSFNPKWPPEVQAQWLESFTRLTAASIGKGK